MGYTLNIIVCLKFIFSWGLLSFVFAKSGNPSSMRPGDLSWSEDSRVHFLAFFSSSSIFLFCFVLWWLVKTKWHQGAPSSRSLLSSRKLLGTRKEPITWLRVQYPCIASIGQWKYPLLKPACPSQRTSCTGFDKLMSFIGAVSCLSYIPDLGNDPHASYWGRHQMSYYFKGW